MKVSELIDLLSEVDPDLEVLMDGENMNWHEVGQVIETEDDETRAEIILIERGGIVN